MFVSAPRTGKNTRPRPNGMLAARKVIHSTSRGFLSCVHAECAEMGTHTCTRSGKAPNQKQRPSLANSIIIVIDSVKLYLFHSMHLAYGRRNALETREQKAPKRNAPTRSAQLAKRNAHTHTQTTEQMTRICLPIMIANNKFIENGISGPAISDRVCAFDFRLEIV